MTSDSRVLPPLPVPDELTKPFWEAANRGRLVIQRCRECRRFYHPPQVVCPTCIESTLSFEEVSGRGTLYSFSIMRDQRVRGFEDKVPYVNVMVELEEQPLLMMVAILDGVTPEDVVIGSPLAVTFQRLTDDIALPQFRLVE